MANLTAEEFLAQVREVAEANDIHLESLTFHMKSGMQCSWYAPEDDEPDLMWAAEMGEPRQ